MAKTSLLLCSFDLCPSRSMEDFEMVDVLGGGHLTTVALCTCRISNMRVAIKMYHKDRMSPLNERQVSRQLTC